MSVPPTIADGPTVASSPCMKDVIALYRQQEVGAIGYILLWAMGVPASLLFFVFLLRGCN